MNVCDALRKISILSCLDQNTQGQDRSETMTALVSQPPTSSVALCSQDIVEQACLEGMQLLTDTERVRLAAGLGLLLFRAREIRPDLVALLRRLSSADVRVWVQRMPPSP